MVKQPKTVVVEWEDASVSFDNRADSKEDVIEYYTKNPYINHSVGWLVHRDEKRIVLAHERSKLHENDQPMFRCTLNIPAGMIRKVTTLA